MARKRISQHPLLAIFKSSGKGEFGVVSAGAVDIWRVEQDLDYRIVLGGHTGPVVALHAVNGALVSRQTNYTPPVLVRCQLISHPYLFVCQPCQFIGHSCQFVSHPCQCCQSSLPICQSSMPFGQSSVLWQRPLLEQHKVGLACKVHSRTRLSKVSCGTRAAQHVIRYVTNVDHTVSTLPVYLLWCCDADMHCLYVI